MKIICLVSPMGAGKDTILKEVIKEYNIDPLISYTDRPIRNGETNGVEYNFVTEEEIYRMMHNGEFIETRVYNTEFGEWVYGLAKNSIDLYSKDNYIVILDFKGLISLREYLVNADKEDCLTSIYISCNPQERLRRALFREGDLDSKKCLEICRRFIDDYSKVEIAEKHCDVVVKNETKDDLKNIIVKIGDVLYGE